MKRHREYVPPTPLTSVIEEQEFTVCTHCEQEIDPSEAAERRVYECSRCGERVVPEEGERARCSQCNIFCAKSADASCPECEESFDDLDSDIETKMGWRTSDGQIHDSEVEAQEWIATEAQRNERRRQAHDETEQMLDRLRVESERRKARMLAAIPRIRERLGVPMPWAHDGWRSWSESCSVYLTGRDIMALAGLDPDERPDTDEDFDRLAEALTARQIPLLGTDEHSSGWYIRARSGSLFSEGVYEDGRAQTSFDTQEFLAVLERLEPGITEP